MVCAIVRSAPKRAYLELDAHPEIKVEYTLNLETHRTSKIPKGMKNEGFEQGYKDHKTRARNSPSVGAARKGDWLAKVGLFSSLVNNLMASAKG